MAYLIAYDLCGRERSHFARIRINVASIEQLWKRQSMLASGVDVRTDIIELTKLSREFDMRGVRQPSISEDDNTILIAM